MSQDERRAAIVTATLHLLEQQESDVTTRQIAQAAGIAEGTIFRVFDDKAELFRAVLARVVDPDLTRGALAAALLDTTTLTTRVEAAVDHLAARSRRVMTVMMAVRAQLPAPGRHERPGPPAALRDAQRHLQADLAELVFAPYADQLRVSPERAALVLRSLVLGFHHPGAHGEDALGPAELADVLLQGVASC